MLLTLRWRILWILWMLVIVLVTTTPWHDFQGHSHWGMVRWIPFRDASLTLRFFFDLVGNLFLYVPFGYLSLRSCGTVSRGVVLWTILLAGLLSVCTELFQVFMHNRIPAITDVFANITGASLGIVLLISLPGSGKA